jgi:hypothetical protein
MNNETQALSPAALYQAMGILPFVPAAEVTP